MYLISFNFCFNEKEKNLRNIIVLVKVPQVEIKKNSYLKKKKDANPLRLSILLYHHMHRN